jgi:hypothetical protein
VSDNNVPSSVEVDGADTATAQWEEPHPGKRFSYHPGSRPNSRGSQDHHQQNDTRHQTSMAIETKHTVSRHHTTAVKQPVRLRRRKSRRRLYKSPLSATQSVMDLPLEFDAATEADIKADPLPTEPGDDQSCTKLPDAPESDNGDAGTPNSPMCQSPLLSDVSNFLGSAYDSDSDMTMVEPESSVVLPHTHDPYGWDAELLRKETLLHQAPIKASNKDCIQHVEIRYRRANGEISLFRRVLSASSLASRKSS